MQLARFALSCPVLSCLALSCLALSYPVLPELKYLKRQAQTTKGIFSLALTLIILCSSEKDTRLR